MANIDSYLKQILTAIYGKDVRQSIHDSISAINNDVLNYNAYVSSALKNAQTSEANALSYKNEAANQAANALTYKNEASQQATNSANSATAASKSEAAAKISETNAKESEIAAAGTLEQVRTYIAATGDIAWFDIDENGCLNVYTNDVTAVSYAINDSGEMEVTLNE